MGSDDTTHGMSNNLKTNSQFCWPTTKKASKNRRQEPTMSVGHDSMSLMTYTLKKTCMPALANGRLLVWSRERLGCEFGGFGAMQRNSLA